MNLLFNIFYRFLLPLILAVILVGCGQKGALYIPKEKNEQTLVKETLKKARFAKYLRHAGLAIRA